MIIDAHAHVDEVKAFGWYDPPEKLIRFMDRYGIDRAVILTYADEPGPEGALQRLLGYMRRYPKRFIPFLRMDPRYDVAQRILQDAVEQHGVKGLKLHPISNVCTPFSPLTVELIRLAGRLGVPTLFHSGDVALSLPWQIGRAAQLCPDAVIIMGHMGGFLHAEEAIRVAERHPNIILETSAMPYPHLIKEAVRRLGAERVVFGSDQPAAHPQVELKKIDVAGLTEQEKQLVLGENIARLLRL
ncbi:MAG: amidohydrolase [Deinococcus sp.]|nr:amidohydrolase [Deinococcus sp.]